MEVCSISLCLSFLLIWIDLLSLSAMYFLPIYKQNFTYICINIYKLAIICLCLKWWMFILIRLNHYLSLHILLSYLFILYYRIISPYCNWHKASRRHFKRRNAPNQCTVSLFFVTCSSLVFQSPDTLAF